MLFYSFLIVLFWVLNNVPLWLKIVLTVGTAIHTIYYLYIMENVKENNDKEL